MPRAAAEVFAFKDYGTHVIVVTRDGQKFSSRTRTDLAMKLALLIAAIAAAGGLQRRDAIDHHMREAQAAPERDFRSLIDMARGAVDQVVNPARCPASAATSRSRRCTATASSSSSMASTGSTTTHGFPAMGENAHRRGAELEERRCEARHAGRVPRKAAAGRDRGKAPSSRNAPSQTR